LSIHHRVNAIVQPLGFGLMAFDRFLVLAALVAVAGVQRALMLGGGGRHWRPARDKSHENRAQPPSLCLK
jgi:hypothetical protein